MKCGLPRCNSGREGVYETVILLWPKGAKRMETQPISLHVHGKLVCDDCRKTAKPLDFLNPEIWWEIRQMIKECKKQPPAIDTADLAFVIPESLEMGGYTV
jgi:hypothetical protein